MAAAAAAHALRRRGALSSFPIDGAPGDDLRSYPLPGAAAEPGSHPPSGPLGRSVDEEEGDDWGGSGAEEGRGGDGGGSANGGGGSSAAAGASAGVAVARDSKA
jgi:hypothetical protein